MQYMAEALNATATVAQLFQGASGRCCAVVHVQDSCVEDVSYLEMRVAGAPPLVPPPLAPPPCAAQRRHIWLEGVTHAQAGPACSSPAPAPLDRGLQRCHGCHRLARSAYDAAIRLCHVLRVVMYTVSAAAGGVSHRLALESAAWTVCGPSACTASTPGATSAHLPPQRACLASPCCACMQLAVASAAASRRSSRCCAMAGADGLRWTTGAAARGPACCATATKSRAATRAASASARSATTAAAPC